MAVKYRKHIYCECKFLEACVSRIENWKSSELDFKELELWICLKTMIFGSDIVLHLDISKDEYLAIVQKKQSELTRLENHLQLLENQRKKGITRIILTEEFVTPDKLDLSNNNQLTSYYLSCLDCETCKKCMNDYGVVVINPDNIKEFECLLIDNGFAISKGEQKCWNSLPNKLPCNSLVLVDNYIFSDFEVGKENLHGIFGSVLPDKLDLDVPFQVSIISPLKKNNNTEDVDSNVVFEEVANLIGELRPELYFKLGIFKCSPGKFHDRTIITNSIYISCAGGFDLINEGKSGKTTTISVVYPFLCNSVKWVANAYSNLVSEVSNIFHNASKYNKELEEKCQRGFYVGTRENRLMMEKSN